MTSYIGTSGALVTVTGAPAQPAPNPHQGTGILNADKRTTSQTDYFRLDPDTTQTRLDIMMTVSPPRGRLVTGFEIITYGSRPFSAKLRDLDPVLHAKNTNVDIRSRSQFVRGRVTDFTFLAFRLHLMRVDGPSWLGSWQWDAENATYRRSRSAHGTIVLPHIRLSLGAQDPVRTNEKIVGFGYTIP